MDDKTLLRAIKDSPLTEEDKAHWNRILDKLNENQKERLYHSLLAKIDIAAAKSAIDRALKIIDEAESEANEDVSKEDVQKKAKEELLQEIEAQNPMMPQQSEEVNAEDLNKHKEDANAKLSALRAELAQISNEAHGSPPPSYAN